MPTLVIVRVELLIRSTCPSVCAINVALCSSLGVNPNPLIVTAAGTRRALDTAWPNTLDVNGVRSMSEISESAEAARAAPRITFLRCGDSARDPTPNLSRP